MEKNINNQLNETLFCNSTFVSSKVPVAHYLSPTLKQSMKCDFCNNFFVSTKVPEVNFFIQKLKPSINVIIGSCNVFLVSTKGPVVHYPLQKLKNQLRVNVIHAKKLCEHEKIHF